MPDAQMQTTDRNMTADEIAHHPENDEPGPRIGPMHGPDGASLDAWRDGSPLRALLKILDTAMYMHRDERTWADACAALAVERRGPNAGQVTVSDENAAIIARIPNRDVRTETMSAMCRVVPDLSDVWGQLREVPTLDDDPVLNATLREQLWRDVTRAQLACAKHLGFRHLAEIPLIEAELLQMIGSGDVRSLRADVEHHLATLRLLSEAAAPVFPATFTLWIKARRCTKGISSKKTKDDGSNYSSRPTESRFRRANAVVCRAAAKARRLMVVFHETASLPPSAGPYDPPFGWMFDFRGHHCQPLSNLRFLRVSGTGCVLPDLTSCPELRILDVEVYRVGPVALPESIRALVLRPNPWQSFLDGNSLWGIENVPEGVVSLTCPMPDVLKAFVRNARDRGVDASTLTCHLYALAPDVTTSVYDDFEQFGDMLRGITSLVSPEPAPSFAMTLNDYRSATGQMNESAYECTIELDELVDTMVPAFAQAVHEATAWGEGSPDGPRVRVYVCCRHLLAQSEWAQLDELRDDLVIPEPNDSDPRHNHAENNYEYDRDQAWGAWVLQTMASEAVFQDRLEVVATRHDECQSTERRDLPHMSHPLMRALLDTWAS